MALKLYADAACTSEITAGNPDTVRKAVTQCTQMTDEKALYIKSDNAGLTYENISVTAVNDNNGTTTSGQVDVMYAPDNAGVAGAYVQNLNLANGAFGAAVKIWRKVIAPNVQAAFKKTNITHQITADEYVV